MVVLNSLIYPHGLHHVKDSYIAVEDDLLPAQLDYVGLDRVEFYDVLHGSSCFMVPSCTNAPLYTLIIRWSALLFLSSFRRLALIYLEAARFRPSHGDVDQEPGPASEGRKLNREIAWLSQNQTLQFQRGHYASQT